MSAKVLVIDLDGATMDLIEPWCPEGLWHSLIATLPWLRRRTRGEFPSSTNRGRTRACKSAVLPDIRVNLRRPQLATWMES